MLGVDTAPAEALNTHRVVGSAASLECRLSRTLEHRGATLVFGDVVGIFVSPESLGIDGRIDPIRMAPLGRLGGSLYTTINVARETKILGWRSIAAESDDG